VDAVELAAELNQEANTDENVSVTIEEVDYDEEADYGGEEIEPHADTASMSTPNETEIITAACASAL